MPTGNTIPARVGFHPTLPLTVAERDIEAWYFPFPTAHIPAPRPGAEVSDRPRYIGKPTASDRVEVHA